MQRKAEKFTNEFQEAKFVMILENSTHLSSQSNKPADLEVSCTIYRYLENVIQGVFFNWCPPKKLKYLEPRLGESTST